MARLMGIVNVTPTRSREEEAKPPEAPADTEKGTSREGPRPRPQPRPGLAGGGAAEMRHDDQS